MGYYVVKVKSIFNGDFANPGLNIFTYSTTETAPTQAGAEVLLNSFKAAFFTNDDAWLNCVNVATLVGDIEIVAPTVPAVLVVDAESFAGLTVGQFLPKFNVVSFFASRTRGDVRQGKKRIGLISEANQINGALEPTFTPFVSQLATVMGEEFIITVSGNSQTFTPVIVKRIEYAPSPGRTAYRLPIAGDPLIMAEATNWDYSDQITTQNSRKR